jgi:uncharacterized protein
MPVRIIHLFAFLALAPSLPARDFAQPTLPRVTLVVNSVTVIAEVADEDHERSAGLMFRESLGANEGMLFIMPGIGPAAFYMRNTRIPLSIAYIAPNGTILEIHDLEPFEETPVRSRFQNIAYALEMEQGWFHNNSIYPGSSIIGLPPHPADTQANPHTQN